MPIGSRGGRFGPILRSVPGRHVAGGIALPATLTTALTGTNNDLKYSARQVGTGGNTIRVTYVVAGVSTPLTVSVSGKDITVNVATNGSSAATSTAAQVAAAIAASAAANALVTTANDTGNDGTGVVTALTQTSLAGGTDWITN
jgi:Bacteriophage tail sheath protein